MASIDWNFLKITILDNSMQSWVVAGLLTVLLSVVLRFLKGRLSRSFRAVADKTTNRLDDAVADMFSRTKLFVLVIVSVWAGTQLLSLPGEVESLVRGIVVVSLLFQVAVWGNRIIRFLVGTYVRLEDADEASRAAMTTALSFIGKLVLWSLVLLIALQNLGVEVTALLASLGVGGIAVALAAQNILGDLFASLSIYFDRPFVVGDFIIVDSLLGTVEKVGLKTTRIRSLHGEQLIFSNNDLLNSRIRNYKRMLERRVLFSIGVIYGTAYEKLVGVPEILREAIEKEELARFDRAHFSGYGDSSLDFEIVYWVKVPDYNTYMDIQQRINFEIFRRFEEEEIEFAFPTRTVYIAKSVDSSLAEVSQR
jgi:small-conductance mechanosensitive channel